MASLIGGKAAHEVYVDELIGEKLTQKALTWMNKQSQPFFLYYASHIAAITDQELTPNDARDGINQLALFVEEAGVSSRDVLLVQPHKQSHTSVRQGDWVYIPGAGDGGWTAAKPGDPERQLYNLKEDPSQKSNLIADHPERAGAMAVLLKRMLAECRN